MSDLSFDGLRAANVERCEESFHPLTSWSPCDWMTALCGEVGEAANLIKKLRRLETSDVGTVALLQTTKAQLLIADVQAELADVVIYADLLAARLGIDLGEAVRLKFDETSRRIRSRVLLSPPDPTPEPVGDPRDG